MNGSYRRQRNRKINSTDDIRNKHSMGYAIGVPAFLTKANNPVWKKFSSKHIDSTMREARKRYERSLERARRAALASEREVAENTRNWQKLVDLESTKRRMNMADTQKYLEMQMLQNVELRPSGRRCRTCGRRKRTRCAARLTSALKKLKTTSKPTSTSLIRRKRF
eukprot:TRINITY_DN7909_c0_g1_i12.p1 TRINITY_DN7909_c0_g1~~TRINITY_DN7909_c0_g1_i12.p1  ORF type:complete len:166 (+),score=27.81 TRINITY_DN7909_c0_g1_i12:1177-1674(+)